MWDWPGSCIKTCPKIIEKSNKIDPKMVPNSGKIDLWSCPGALWAPSWRQDGPRATPRAKFNEKYSILGWPVGSKMEPKSVKNLMKNRLDFCNDFESTFFRSWVDFGSKTSPKWGVSGSLFQPCCEYARNVSLNNPPMVLLYCLTFGGSMFDLKRYLFQLFFRRRF